MTHSLKLLLIEDDEIDRMVILSVLKQIASPIMEVVQATTASEGVHCASEQLFDFILLDYCLPEQNGLAVLRTLSSTKNRDTPILMLSNNEDESIAQQCLEGGAKDFILKDEISARRLKRAIQHAKQRTEFEISLKHSYEQLRILSEHDALTGLANRRGFDMALNTAIAQAKRGLGSISLLLLDLDDFKQINDTYGHTSGDMVLIEVANRLRMIIRDGDFLCRLGGDEFVILARNSNPNENPAVLARRLILALQQPITIGTEQRTVTASIGIAVLNDACENAENLLIHADIAMYLAKREGRNQSRFYSDRMKNNERKSRKHKHS